MHSYFINKARQYLKCKNSSKKKIKECFYPRCNNESINSHVLQRKGILNQISTDSHLWTFEKDVFKENEFAFKRTGLKKAFAFHCFCNIHDTQLFKEIEVDDIDFTTYKTNLLFTLRTVYDEIYKEIVYANTRDCLLKNENDLFDIDKLKKESENAKLAIDDLKMIVGKILYDLDNDSQQFVFQNRTIPKIGLCVSSFFTYDTSEEIELMERENGSKLERYTELFITIFPFKNDSQLIMAYEKIDTNKVKNYVDEFFQNDRPEICYQKITNLIIFNCQNKVFNNQFYNEKIKDIEYKYIEATQFMLNEENKNERTLYNINFYSNTFKDDFVSLDFELLKT
ncbi:hypothetical protein [Chryseobacterium sp. 18068]|uniref:hypothetical protein n=1 Tax=Chryseobacterium sp. 18068 TaxID=2681414 RepID=UPI00135C78E4|nr:hypothetical protein [Chryseobacterium sp. 18068]